MREPTVARDRERGATGVIDTLSLGYATVNRHPWIIAIPVLLDLFFWLGPRLSMAPLIQQVFSRIPASAALPADLAQNYQDYSQALLDTGEHFNLLSLLATNFPGIPSLMAGREGIGTTTELASASLVLGLLLLIPLAGVWFASLYYSWLGRELKGPEFGGLWGRAWKTWLRIVGFLLIALAAMVAIGVPLSVAAFVIGSFSSSVVGLMVSFVWVAAMWAQFYLFFVVDAIVISDVGPRQAIRNSLAVVRYNLGSSLGLVILVWIIMLGMPIVWASMSDNPVGVVAAILGNAYVSTGLAVASMLFYRERFAAISSRSRG